MRLKVLFFLFYFSNITVAAQHYTEVFFPGMEFRSEIDTLPLDQFIEIMAAYPEDFRQVLFEYGGPEDSTGWEYIDSAIANYPDVVRPIVNQLDLNWDNERDLVLSFLGGNEYTLGGVYISLPEQYLRIFEGRAVFYGVYENGDLCMRRPACCTDPTNEFYRLDRRGGQITDSLSIAVRGANAFPTQKELLKAKKWTLSTDTLYVYSETEGEWNPGAYLPGAKLRIIKKRTTENGELMYCEIIGDLVPDFKRHNLFYRHAYTWLSKEMVAE